MPDMMPPHASGSHATLEKLDRPNFLPDYEAAINEQLRAFGDPEAQHGNLAPFDKIQEPQQPVKQRWMTKRNLSMLCIAGVAFMFVLAGIVGLVASRLSGPQGVGQASSTPTSMPAENLTQTDAPTRSAGVSTITVYVTGGPSTLSSTSPLPSDSTTIITITMNPSLTGSLITSYTTVTPLTSKSSSSTPASILSAEASISSLIASYSSENAIHPTSTQEAAQSTVFLTTEPPRSTVYSTTVILGPVVTNFITT